MWPDLQEGVLYVHHFSTHISPPFYRYIIRQSMCACIVANSSPVCFSWGCFLRHVRCPWRHECSVCIQLFLLAVKQRPLGCKVSQDLVVILSTDLCNYFLGQFKHQWIHNTRAPCILELHSIYYFKTRFLNIYNCVYKTLLANSVTYA